MKQKTILITGATGFLGSYITRELLNAGFRLKLLLRGTTNSPAHERHSEIFPNHTSTPCVFDSLSSRLEIIEGDITKCCLGLDTKEYIRLAETVDEVFHCAAATKFNNDSNDTLSNTNVLGTENIASFCYAGKLKRLHYISTAYVAGKRRDTVFEYELNNGQDFNNTYERSKFNAEKRLQEFNRFYNIPATVYRPSIIAGDSRSGYTKNYDNIYVFGKGLYRLKNCELQKGGGDSGPIRWNDTNHLPPMRILGDKHGTINLIPIDYAARAIVAVSRRAESINETFHIVNPSPPSLGELAEWTGVATGAVSTKIVDAYEFRKQPYTMVEKLFLQGTEAFQPYMFGEPSFDSTNTRKLLIGTGIECPLITQELINRVIQYGIDTNWGKNRQTVVSDKESYSLTKLQL
ncbi:MAG TPA: SDR family oxidoreductase [Candidatus Brocadiaceae bacterium]